MAARGARGLAAALLLLSAAVAAHGAEAVAEAEPAWHGAEAVAGSVAGAVAEAVVEAGPAAEARAVTAAGTKSHDNGGKDGGDRVYLRSITALVFSANSRTRARHGSPRPQLECVGGSAAGMFWGSDHYPRIAQCTNIGWDGSSIQWRCEATLDEGLEFGDTTVMCAGYDSPGDEYIYRGSCHLEYTLNFSKFELSFAHVIYGSFLTLAMLWFYWQARFWIHQRIGKVEESVDKRVDRLKRRKDSGAMAAASYGATEDDASAGYTGRPL